MGRPLNKKYFGNRNLGSSSTTADDGIGGLRVASVTIDVPGSYTTRPTVTFSAPDLAGPGGVTATGTTNMEALSATVVDGKTGYVVGDLLTITGAGGAKAYVKTIDGDGTVLTVNFTDTGAVRGDQTDLTGITTAVATTTNSSGGTAGVTLNVAYRVKSITVTEAGSGYTNDADAGLTFSAGAAEGTVVMATDTGSAGSATNQENAIRAYAYIPTADGGSSRVIADIKKQTNDRRYKVETAQGTGICQLRTDGGNGAGTMDITAFDSEGGEYWVWKLTSRKAVLVVKGVGGGTQFATGTSVPWTFGTATEDYSVKIQNA